MRIRPPRDSTGNTTASPWPLAAGLALLAVHTAHAMDVLPPKYIAADVTWVDPVGHTNRTLRGQL